MPHLIQISTGNHARAEDIRAVRFIHRKEHGDRDGIYSPATLIVDLVTGASILVPLDSNKVAYEQSDRIAAEINGEGNQDHKTLNGIIERHIDEIVAAIATATDQEKILLRCQNRRLKAILAEADGIPK